MRQRTVHRINTKFDLKVEIDIRILPNHVNFKLK